MRTVKTASNDRPVITAMTKAADLALGKYSQDKELITLLTDAVAMALQYNHEVNHSRRLAMKKEMHKTHAALMKRTSLSMRSWQRRLEVCRDLPLILQQTGYSRKTVKTLICFWNITCATLLLLLQLDNVLQKCSTSYFCADFMPFVRVHVV